MINTDKIHTEISQLGHSGQSVTDLGSW